MRYAKINLITGLFIEDVITDEPANDLIATPCPAGFHLPKWTGTQWVEGKTSQELTVIQAAQAVVVAKETNRKTIEDYLATAIQTNKTYLAIAAPTAAQKEVQLNKTSRQLIRIERLLLNMFDAVE